MLGDFGVLLGIAGDRHLERCNRLDAPGEIGGVHVAAGRRLIARADAVRRIAAQGHDVAHAEIPIVADDLVDLAFRRRDAGEMRRWLQRRLAQDAGNSGVSALAGRAAGAISDRDIFRAERFEPPDRAPQRLVHGCRLGREELERHVDGAAAENAALGFGGCEHHAATSTLAPRRFLRPDTAGFCPSQSETVSLPPAGSGASSRKRASLSPAVSNRRPS